MFQADAGSRQRVVIEELPKAVPEGRPGRRCLEVIGETARRGGLVAECDVSLDRVEVPE